MKEFEKEYFCSAEVIAKKLPVLQDRKHIKGNLSLTAVFEVKSFQNRILKVLDEPQNKYLSALIGKLAMEFDSVTALRIAFNSGKSIFDDNDPSTKSDEIILKKIYGFQSSIPLRR